MDATDLAFAGVAAQARMIVDGKVSSRELVEVYLERIGRLDPLINAFRVVFAERALLEADQADGRRGAGGQRPLLGVPIAVKDELDLAGEVTTWGTNAYGEPASKDSEIVRRARAAGAVVIGKTHMPELGAVPWTESSTWGVTRNPWHLQHSPGGSSGGSAAAVAAGLVGAALAGDGGGSIRFPAAYCGLFGLKTQRGRVPLAPHLDAWHGLVVGGVLTRSVRDSALFYDAIADGPPDTAPSTSTSAPSTSTPAPSTPTPVVSRGSFLDAVGPNTGSSSEEPVPRVLRIAVASRLPPSPLTRLHGENRDALAETVALLGSLGHEVDEREVDYGPLSPPPEFTAIYLRSIHEEAARLAHPERLERRTRALARLGGVLPSGVVEWARRREAAYAARLNKSLDDHDVLLTPVTPAPPPMIGAHEGHGWLRTALTASGTVAYAACWNFTGQPACSVPAGFDANGLPRGVQLVGRPNQETTLIALAAQIEAERPWADRRPPGFA